MDTFDKCIITLIFIMFLIIIANIILELQSMQEKHFNKISSMQEKIIELETRVESLEATREFRAKYDPVGEIIYDLESEGE